MRAIPAWLPQQAVAIRKPLRGNGYRARVDPDAATSSGAEQRRIPPFTPRAGRTPGAAEAGENLEMKA